MSDPNTTLPLVQAYKEIDQLKAELAKAQASEDRLFDLVRYQRAELHQEGLVSDEEYASLCTGGSIGNGAWPVRRLEGYDSIKADLAKAQELLREVMTGHSDTESPDYIFCNEDKCNWCERASRLFAMEGKV